MTITNATDTHSLEQTALVYGGDNGALYAARERDEAAHTINIWSN